MVADLKGVELFYYVYDFLLYSTLVTSPPLQYHLGLGSNREGATVIVGVCSRAFY